MYTSLTLAVRVARPLLVLKTLFDHLWSDESGQDMVEYALVALCMGLSTIAGVHGLATTIVNNINFVFNGFASATAGRH
jgi:Flp pilus assembly pilin Flp